MLKFIYFSTTRNNISWEDNKAEKIDANHSNLERLLLINFFKLPHFIVFFPVNFTYAPRARTQNTHCQISTGRW